MPDPKVKSPTLAETRLACGTSLADVPANATLIYVDEDGNLTRFTCDRWDIYVIGEASPEGPRFEIRCQSSDNSTCLEAKWLFLNVKAAVAAAEKRLSNA